MATTPTTKKTRAKRINKVTTTRIQNLISKNKWTYKEIAEKCKVSTGTVGRMARATQ